MSDTNGHDTGGTSLPVLLLKRVQALEERLAALEGWPEYQAYVRRQEEDQRRRAEAERLRRIESELSAKAAAALREGWIEAEPDEAMRAGVVVLGGRSRLTAGGDLAYQVGMNEWRLIEAATPEQRLRRRRRYHAAKLTQAEADFHGLKEALDPTVTVRRTWDWPLDRLGPPPASPEGHGVAELRFLKEIVGRERAALAEVEAAIAELPEEQERRRREEEARRSEAATRAEQCRQAALRHAITLDDTGGITVTPTN